MDINKGVSQTEERLFYTVNEFCMLIPLGRNSVYKLVNEEGFPKIKVGKKILIPKQGLDKWISLKTEFSYITL